MSDIQELILQSTSKILKENCTKELMNRVEEGEWPQKLWETIADSGLLFIGIPEKNGGAGGDSSDTFHLFKLIGEFAVPLPIFETIFVNWFITERGFKPISVPAAFALNEQLEAKPADNGFLVSGKLHDVSWVNYADTLLVKFTNNGQKKLALIDREKYIVEEGYNLAGEPEGGVTVNNAFIPLENVLSDENELNGNVMQVGALAKCAMMSGALDKILNLTIYHVKEREQFGRPLYKLQAIQQNLAILSGKTISANTITDYAIESFNNCETFYKIGNAKIVVNESASIVSDIAHQIHGAIGTTYEHILHHYTRRLWAWRDQFGNETYWSNLLAVELYNSREDLWSVITN